MTINNIDCKNNTVMNSKIMNLSAFVWSKCTSKNILIVLGSVNLVLGFSFLIMLNGLATQAFDLESLKSEKLTLQKELEAADIALAIPDSLYALESNEIIQSLPDVGSKTFVTVSSADLALLMK